MNEHQPTERTEIEAGQPGPTEQPIDKTADADTITASDEPDQKILTPETPTNAPATSETKSPGRNGNDEVRKAADED